MVSSLVEQMAGKWVGCSVMNLAEALAASRAERTVHHLAGPMVAVTVVLLVVSLVVRLAGVMAVSKAEM